MSDAGVFARLVNADGELIAEGRCWLDERSAQATLEPSRTTNVVRRECGDTLLLELESGRTVRVSDRLMIVRIAHPGHANGHNGNGNGRRSLYRLRVLTEQAQDAKAAGAAEEGTPALRAIGGLRYDGETPAAR